MMSAGFSALFSRRLVAHPEAIKVGVERAPIPDDPPFPQADTPR
jgi:hypothetical protein